MTLVPPPNTLGLESPQLGPWFDTDLELPVPGADLGVGISLAANAEWLPPATGTLSLAVTTAPRPAILAGLRQPDGTQALTDNRLVALFRLLPEVESRLGGLLSVLPTADGTTPAAGTPTRAAARWLALELPESPPTLATLLQRIDPAVPNSITEPADQAAHLGLTVDAGGNLGNAAVAMTDLKQAGETLGAHDRLLVFPAATTATLYAFDGLGRPLDPGAVAAWWASLAGTFNELWADGITGGERRTTAVADQLAVHLVGPNDGPAGAGVLSRLETQNVTGTGPVRVRDSGNPAAQFSFDTSNSTTDAAPLPRMAVLPAGNYLAAANLWQGGSVGNLDRDFVRLALVDLELHLTGQPRLPGSGAGDAATRRANDQKRVSSRIMVGQATAAAGQTVLLPTTDTALAGLAGTLGAGNATLIAAVLERRAGSLTPPTLPAVAPPVTLPPLVLTALIGGGEADGGTVAGQQVLVELNLGTGLAGAWVRVWPQYFDSDDGVHRRGAGGGGLADANGDARLVVRLADGATEPGNLLGLDVTVVTGTAAARYPEVRLPRPAPEGGDPVALPDVTASVWSCETGQLFTGTIANGSLAPGSTLVELTEPRTLVDPGSVGDALWNNQAIAVALTAGDTVQLTEPAWRGWVGGEAVPALSGTGASVTRLTRNGLQPMVQVGSPCPTQTREEVAASVLATGAADSFVGALRPLGAHHELPFHLTGHPGAPADDERHGGGARIRGPAVVSVAEILRERLAGPTWNLGTAAATPLPQPANPGVPGTWSAVLRTIGFGVEAEPGLVPALNAIGLDAFPWDGPFSAIQTWLANLGITIPGGTDDAVFSIQRAISRRLLGARSGYREAAQAMAYAFSLAEDYAYLETPALDHLAFGEPGDQLDLLQVLIDRVTANPALRVIVCVPVALAPGSPDKLQRVRSQVTRQALADLRTAAGDRLAVFTPATGPGRALHLDATTVLVDDAWAITGGTHLWRRGLSFDSSLAVAAFDERVATGRPAEVVAFRRAVLGNRLGLGTTPAGLSLLPEDPAELVRAIRAVSAVGGGQRLSAEPVEEPEPVPSAIDIDAWNPDGSTDESFDPLTWLIELSVAIQAELAAEVPGEL